MTEEDQQLVARAALHGARFCRSDKGTWTALENEGGGWFTIGRAASAYLRAHNLNWSVEQHKEYLRCTFVNEPQVEFFRAKEN